MGQRSRKRRHLCRLRVRYPRRGQHHQRDFFQLEPRRLFSPLPPNGSAVPFCPFLKLNSFSNLSSFSQREAWTCAKANREFPLSLARLLLSQRGIVPKT